MNIVYWKYKYINIQAHENAKNTDKGFNMIIKNLINLTRSYHFKYYFILGVKNIDAD